MANRYTLAKSRLEEFANWLGSRGWTRCPTKGDWEVARFYKGYGWLLIFDRNGAKEHYTIQRGIGEKLLYEWLREQGKGPRR